MCCSMLFDLLTILGSILGIFGFILLYINTRPYDWQNIQEWSKRYFLYHPDYYEIKRAREIEEDRKRGIPSAPTDTSFEDVFVKSRNRNKIIAIVCVIGGLSIPIIQTILHN